MGRIIGLHRWGGRGGRGPGQNAILYLVITYLADCLAELFHSNLTAYAIIALVFIVAQSVLLDSLTSFIMDRLG